MDKKAYCEYGFNCPYHKNGVGCCAKHFIKTKMECDHYKKMELKEKGL